MTDSLTDQGHDDINRAIPRLEAYLERLEQVALRLEKIASSGQNDNNHDGHD